MCSFSIEIYLQKSWSPIEAENLIVFQLISAFIGHVFLGDYSRLYEAVGVLIVVAIIIDFKTLVYLLPAGFEVQFGLVIADYETATVMRTFKYELIRELAKINVFKF